MVGRRRLGRIDGKWITGRLLIDIVALDVPSVEVSSHKRVGERWAIGQMAVRS